MEDTTTLIKKNILNFGFILGIISVLFGVILYVTNNHTNQHWAVSLIGIAILTTFITLGIQSFKKGNNHVLSLSQALKVGIGISLIGAIISVIWMVVLMTVLEPNMAEQIIEVSQEKMLEKNPTMSESEIEIATSMMRKFTTPGINSAIVIITNLFLGLIISLITGLIMKKED